jgi:hypothetical protein
VAAEVLEWRLSRLTAAERAELVATLQGYRAMGRHAWLTTGDRRSISGRLVIRREVRAAIRDGGLSKNGLRGTDV